MWLTSSGVLCPLLSAHTTTKAVINGTKMGSRRHAGCVANAGSVTVRSTHEASISCPQRVWLTVQFHQGDFFDSGVGRRS